MTPQLQLALDSTSDAAFVILRQALSFVDIIEIGTPLIYREGVAMVRHVKEAYPDHPVLADLKIMDAGEEEAAIAFEGGADYVTVLGLAADSTVRGAVKSARRFGGKIMADMIQTERPLERGVELLALGCDVLCIHTGYDLQAEHSPLATFQVMRAHLPDALLAVAGGINRSTIGDLLPYHPSIVVVGGAITRAEDPAQAAQALKEKLV